MKKGTRLEFIIILLGGLVNLLFSIWIFSPILSDQLWSAYYLILAVALISLSFRVSRRRNAKRDSWFIILIGLLSINPYLYTTRDLPLFNPLPIIGGIIALIKSHMNSPSQNQESSPSQKRTFLPPPKIASKNKIVLTPAYKNVIQKKPIMVQYSQYPKLARKA